MDSKIVNAIILAAGKGSRMKELSVSTPKPLICVKNKPLIDYKVEMLQNFGINQFVVNVSYLGEQIKEHLETKPDLKVNFSVESEPLETGGGIKKALPLLGAKPFFVLNSDTIVKGNGILEALTQQMEKNNVDICLTLVPCNKVIGHDKPYPDYVIGDKACIYAGIAAVRPEIFKFAPDKDIFSLKVLFDYAEDNHRLGFIFHDDYLFHVGTPEALRKTEELL